MNYVRKDAENDYVIADDAGRIISRHSCRDWADQALHKLTAIQEPERSVSPQP